MTQMPAVLFERYQADPAGTDDAVRQQMGIPEDRYFTVTTWPEHLAGRVFVDKTRTRVVKAQKISKSNQP
jgi:hypothetical protein